MNGRYFTRQLSFWVIVRHPISHTVCRMDVDHLLLSMGSVMVCLETGVITNQSTPDCKAISLFMGLKMSISRDIRAEDCAKGVTL